MPYWSPFKFGDITVHVRYLGLGPGPGYGREFEVKVMDADMKEVLFLTFTGHPTPRPTLDLEILETAAHVIRDLYMALMPLQPWDRRRQGEVEKAFRHTAIDLSDESVDHAYIKAMELLESLNRRPGPKDWAPGKKKKRP